MDYMHSDYEMLLLSENPASSKNLARNIEIPRACIEVLGNTSIQQSQAKQLFYFGRRNFRSAMISGARIEWDKNPKRFATAIETKLLATFNDHLWFRGISRQALLCMPHGNESLTQELKHIKHLICR